MKKIRMYIVIIVFLMISVLPAVSIIFDVDFNIKLSGTTVSVGKPLVSIERVMSGDSQTEINAYLQENIPIRNAVIKIGNQVIYNVFNKSTNENIVIGKNKQLFEKAYITKELQYSGSTPNEKFEEEIAHLEELKEKLNEKGIHVLLFLTPYKTEFYKEDIPWVYEVCAPQIEDNEDDYERFISLLRKSNIDYFDAVEYSYELQKQYEEELFPKTGTHWSQLSGARVTKKMAKEIEGKFGYDLPDIEVTYEMTKQPLWPDADLLELLNISSKPSDEFYAPSITLINEGKVKPNIFARGCSFMGQTVYNLIDKGLVNESVYMENTFARINNSEIIGVNDYESLDLKGMLEGKDLIIFEANQMALDNVGLGLMEYIYQNYDKIFE